ncbi:MULTISPECIES: HNH endonuclease [unclassified Janthinobacterium]|uniref:HNH endonuclease n=1 Tax=unclassified Janthinobacterium TaxID=2610881 RepID=UPI0027130AD0|nr:MULTISPECIES: HNH endonuclease [unclassified Janthinobacterium]MDO8064883.1 HNH endonuclease [Janthinobacterium sp. SUN206]MDO8071222.1 HNH endonuclease [Janthinobacterium sp. SUN176]
MKNKENVSFKKLITEINSFANKIEYDEKFWDSDEFKPLKEKIKGYLKEKSGYCCSYCRRDIKGEHNMVLDIEHVLEKDKFPRLTFNMENLLISCRRCNFKKCNFRDAYTTQTPDEEFLTSYTYKFVNPNLDKYYDYISYINISINEKRIIKYLPWPRPGVPNSEKAWYTYENFDLRELERFELMKQMRIKKPNTVLALQNPVLQERVAASLEASHALSKVAKQEAKEQRRAEKAAKNAPVPD